MRFTPAWQLGFLAPFLVVVMLVTDIGMRLLPLDRFAFRSWEVVRRFPMPDAPFEANRSFAIDQTYGDLAALGNLPAFREYRGETFTTDALGYRNPPDLVTSDAVAALLVGDSFAVGLGVPDEEVLSAQLTRLTGRIVYNGGSEIDDPYIVQRIRTLNQRLAARPRLVIYEYLEGASAPPPSSGCTRLRAWADLEAACRYLGRLALTATVSPLEITLQKGYRLLQNDVTLANVYKQRVRHGVLKNGDTTLFLPTEIDNTRRYREDGPAAAYFQQVAADVRQQGQELLLVLVPNKYTVYQSLLQEEAAPSPAAPSYLDRLEQRLGAAGIPVINLTSAFRAAAADGLDRRDYLYWRDDWHWNARGMAVAAQEIARAWDALEQR